MTRNAYDFEPTDPNGYEEHPIGYDFAAYLVVGETIVSAVWEIDVVVGSDPTPNLRLIGNPSVQGTIVSQMVADRIGGVRYNHTATITTSLGNVWSQNAHELCSPIL